MCAWDWAGEPPAPAPPPEAESSDEDEGMPRRGFRRDYQPQRRPILPHFLLRALADERLVAMENEGGEPVPPAMQRFLLRRLLAGIGVQSVQGGAEEEGDADDPDDDEEIEDAQVEGEEAGEAEEEDEP